MVQASPGGGLVGSGLGDLTLNPNACLESAGPDPIKNILTGI